MKYNIAQRIGLKFLHYVNLGVGKCVDVLTRWNIYGKVPFTVKGRFGEVIEVEHDYPKNYNSADKAKFDEWKSYKTFPHDLFYVSDVLLTSDGIVLKKHRTFIPALPHPIFRNKYGLLYNFFIRVFYRKKKLERGKNYLLVFDNWSWDNYFHWTIDSLCRLQLLRDHVKMDFTVLLPEASPQYVKDSLKLYGFTDVVLLLKNCKTRVPDLYVMNYAAWSGQQHPAILSEMANFVRSQIPAAEGEKDRRVYVSRARAYSRKVSNEEEVVEVLKQNGFEILYFEGMSFREQVALMQNVKYFVTSHGANMTNLIYLPKGAKILELIRSEGRANFCYWSVASCLGYEYFYQLCPLNQSDNIRVDVKELQHNLELLLS